MRTALCLALALALAAPLGCKRTDPKLAAEVQKEVDAYLAKHPVLKPEENSALKVEEAAEALEELPKEFMEEGFDPAKPGETKLLEAYIAKNEKPLADLVAGIGGEKFQYTSDLDKGSQAKIPSLRDFRKAGRVLVLRGKLRIAQGNPEGGLKDFLACLDLGASLTKEPFLISHMIGVAVESMALLSMLDWMAAAPPGEEILDAMVKGIAASSKRRGSITDGLDGEYYIFQLSTLAKAASGEIAMWSNYRKDYEIFRNWHDQYSKADPERYFEIPENVRTGKIEEELSKNTSGSDLAAIAMPSLSKVLESAARQRALWRGTALVAAILRDKVDKGSLHKDLTVVLAGVEKGWVMDPFTGKELIYRVEGEGFALYSAGPDGKDDGGKDERWTGKINPEETKDLVFHK